MVCTECSTGTLTKPFFLQRDTLFKFAKPNTNILAKYCFAAHVAVFSVLPPTANKCISFQQHYGIGKIYLGCKSQAGQK